VLLVQTEFTNGPAAAGEARRAIAGLAENLPANLVADVTLLVSELVTNSYRHAGMVEGNSIGLRVELTGRMVRIEVSDRGEGRAPAIREGGYDGGWGLRIVETVADRWGTSRVASGTVVWFEMEAVT
jgi:serine/threonine-protein kinase RsbW